MASDEQDPVAEAGRPYFRVAFAQGWAASGGPMTDHVRAGCVAAVHLAADHAHEPGILEATLRLGQLEGTWAQVYDRREKLHDRHLRRVLALWRQAVHRVDIPLAVRRFRQSLGLSEAADPGDTQHRRLVAKAIAAVVLDSVAGGDAAPDARDQLVTAIASALRDGSAEGVATAIALAAQQAGLNIDWDTAYRDALAAAPDMRGDAAGALDRMVSGAAADLSGALSRTAAGGADEEDMADAATATLDSGRAVDSYLDTAIGAAVTAGMLGWLALSGVGQVDFLTVGGANVCALCLDAEAGSPWSASDVPRPPLHPNCRCSISPVDAPSPGLFAQYLGG